MVREQQQQNFRHVQLRLRAHCFDQKEQQLNFDFDDFDDWQLFFVVADLQLFETETDGGADAIVEMVTHGDDDGIDFLHFLLDLIGDFLLAWLMPFDVDADEDFDLNINLMRFVSVKFSLLLHSTSPPNVL